MSFLDKLKNIFKGKTINAISINNGTTPLYSQYGQNIFASDVVMQAVNCIISEIVKLKPTHIKKTGTDISPQNSSIQNVLDYPNELMTTVDFIEKIMWNYYFNSNSFIIPKYYIWEDEKTGKVKRHYDGLYPVRPSQVDFIQDASERYYVKFYFANNIDVTLPYSDVIHLRREYSLDDFMGGNSQGQPNDQALKDTVALNESILKSIASNLKASTKINGIVKVKTFLKDEDLKKSISNFNKLLENSEGGLLPLDSTTEYVPLDKNIKLIDADTLKFIDEKILRNFGIPLSILTGDYTKEQYEAFYQKTLEPIVIKIGQAFTKTLFTQREKSFGNEIIFYPEELAFLNRNQAIEVIKWLGQSGTLYENEKRTILGLKPIKELEGVRMQSLNYINVNDASKYQGDDESDESSNSDEEKIKELMQYRSREKDIGANMNNQVFKDDKECRSYDFEVRAKKDEKHGAYIEGQPIVYGDKYDCCGMFEETIDEGALDKTDLKDVRLLVNHNIDMIPLARSRNNNENSSMQLKVENDGMYIRANLDIEKNNDAKSLYSAIERGDITGMSFMFQVDGEKWDDLDSDYPKRHITSISKVFEVSAVTFPAYENTSIKTRSKSVLDNARMKSLESESKQTLDSAKNELELEKLKFRARFM
ncbi:MAG: HK97 family phage prohead protease [Lachnospiraceae bacterium]|nr:HK97 family phage prohead protease [Lachnospiraceae bacterium]